MEIDKKLIEQAQNLGNHKTREATVNAALSEYIQRRQQQEIVTLFNTIDYYDDYDYKEQRKVL